MNMIGKKTITMNHFAESSEMVARLPLERSCQGTSNSIGFLSVSM